MPNDDSGAEVWMQNFARKLGENPEALGSTRCEADLIASLVEAYSKALETAQSPVTRTTPAIAAKNAARSKAVLAIRAYLSGNGAMQKLDVAARFDLGLPVSEAMRKAQKRQIAENVKRSLANARATREVKPTPPPPPPPVTRATRPPGVAAGGLWFAHPGAAQETSMSAVPNKR